MKLIYGMHYYYSKITKVRSNFWIVYICFLFLASCSDNHSQLNNQTTSPRYFGQQNAAQLNTRKIVVNSETLTVEVARTPDQRVKGLMFRDSLAQNRGMLFVFEQPQIMKFWMKNTYIPLDIAYIDQNGEIMEIHQLQPRSESTVYSSSYCVYALEVNRDWFKINNIETGDKIIFISDP